MHHVGYKTGLIEDETRSHWTDDAPRPIKWSAWYPADGPGRSLASTYFDLGPVTGNAKFSSDGPFPVVLMSHGTGGAPEGQGWLAARLAEAGYVALAPHHHGNTGSEPYLAQGFMAWWERATDMSVLLTTLSETRPFAGRLDMEHVHATGFSLGGYTVLALAGARTSIDLLLDWAIEAGIDMRGPREFPDAADEIPRLLEVSDTFRDSWERQGADFTDPRIRSVVAMAPAPPVRGFIPATVTAIQTPVTLITGEADTEAPSVHYADWLEALNPNFSRFSLGDKVGHYCFLGQPANPSAASNTAIFADAAGVDRDLVHDETARLVLAALDAA